MRHEQRSALSNIIPKYASAIRLLGLAAIIIGVPVLVSLVGCGEETQDNESMASAYVESQLKEWRAGRETELLFTKFLAPVLVEYEILDAVPSKNSDASLYMDGVDVSVQLTFSTNAGGRPVKVHTFSVAKHQATEDWVVFGDTKFLP